MGQFEGLRLSSFLAHQRLPSQSQTGGGRVDFGGSSLDRATVVSSSPGTSLRHSANSAPNNGHSDVSFERTPSSSHAGSNLANRLEVIRSSFCKQGFSEPVVELLLAGVRNTTHASYQSAWTTWRSWCNSWSANPMSPSLSLVLQFLSDCYRDGKAYSTINIYRSMLSSTLDELEGHKIGQHPVVMRLMRGIYNSRPPAPRYTSTWNVETVLEYINNLGNNADLSLPIITRKLAILLALTTLLRVSEIASITRESIQIDESKASFALSKHLKAQREGPLHTITLGRFPQRPNLCPVDCLGYYTYQTDVPRGASGATSLFVTTRRPFNSATPSTVGHWIKKVLKSAGIDTSKFSAHSTRGASASRAVKIGVPIDNILGTAHWSRESTFTRFYRRDTEPEFAESILSGVLLFIYLFCFEITLKDERIFNAVQLKIARGPRSGPKCNLNCMN